MTDKILALLALATMIATVGVIAFFVPDIDLIVVIILVSLMAIYDFWQTFRTRN